MNCYNKHIRNATEHMKKMLCRFLFNKRNLVIVMSVESQWKRIEAEAICMEQKLWEHPELPLLEKESCEILVEWLCENGFHVTKDYLDVPNAFLAAYGKPPYITYLAEYDALKGLSNKAVPRKESNHQRAGHGCLHNQIGAVNTAAAIALKRYIQNEKTEDGVAVVGCPAEELLIGKVILLKKGAFNQSSVLLTHHVDYQTGVIARPTLGAISGEICFFGKSNHGGANRSFNALDCIENLIQTVDKLCSHEFKDISVEHIIRASGDMPNITPEKASVWYTLRHVDTNKAVNAYLKIEQFAKSIASIYNVQVKLKRITQTRGYLPNDTISDVLFDNISKLHFLDIEDEDKNFIKELVKATGCEDVFEDEKEEFVYLKNGVDRYSQDDGEASHFIPLGRVNFKMPEQIPLHSVFATAAANSMYMKKRACLMGETLYETGVSLIKDKTIIHKAKEELNRRVEKENETPFVVNIDDIQKVWQENPESFWNDTWMD